MSWKILLLLLTGVLIVSLVKSKDNGYFSMCIGKTFPKIRGLPENVTAIQGAGSISIACRAKSCFPDPTYQWLDPQQRDLSKLRGFSVEGGLLTVFNVSAEGKYTCKVADDHGTDVASLTLHVHVPPRIVQFFGNLTRVENSTVGFECRARGVPKPDVVVIRQKGDVTYPGRVKLLEYHEDDLRVLQFTIAGVERSDGGVYRCQASSAAGTDAKTGRLEVQFGPDMTLTPKQVVKAWSAHPGNLTCIAEANPEASLVWKFRGAPIDPSSDDRYQIFGSHHRSSLLVRTDDNVSDVFGEYSCEAENFLGRNSRSVFLEKATPPGPISKILFYRVTPTTITFLFLMHDTGGLPIANYIARYKLFDHQETPPVTIIWKTGSNYTLRDLRPRLKYQISIAASNDAGRGPWKVTHHTMPNETAPEPPRIVTEPGTVSRHPDRLNVRWEADGNGGAVVTLFEIRYFKVKRCDSGWLQADQAVKKFLFNDRKPVLMELVGLEPDSFYKIQILAVNRVGKSLPGCVVVKTGSVPEEGRFFSGTAFVATVLVAVTLFVLICYVFEVGKSLVLSSCRRITSKMFRKRQVAGDGGKNDERGFLQGDVQREGKQSCVISYIKV